MIFVNIFIHLVLAALGRCCVGSSPVAAERGWGVLLSSGARPPCVVAPLVAEHGLWVHGFVMLAPGL